MSSPELKKKYIDFVSEPMREKEVGAVPGIDANHQLLLAKKGFDQAYVLFGQFLVLKKDKHKFIEWLIELTAIKRSSALICFEAFMEWSQNFLD